jgi:hypothetical protein
LSGVSDNQEELTMALLKTWRDMAYSATANKGDLQRLWADYFQKEKDIYAQLLKNPDEVVKGTVKELAEKYGVDIMTMTGFLDGINDSLKEQNPIEEMEEDTEVNLGFDKELLYKNRLTGYMSFRNGKIFLMKQPVRSFIGSRSFRQLL